MTTPKPPTDAAWVPCSTCGTVVISPCVWVEGKPYHQKCVPGTGTISTGTQKPPTLAERLKSVSRGSVLPEHYDALAAEVAALEAENARLRTNEAAFCGCGDACNRDGSLCPVCADALRARIAAMDETAESLATEPATRTSEA